MRAECAAAGLRPCAAARSMTSRVLAPNSSEKSPRIFESTKTKSKTQVARSAGAGGPPAGGIEEAEKGRAKATMLIANKPITATTRIAAGLANRRFGARTDTTQTTRQPPI